VRARLASCALALAWLAHGEATAAASGKDQPDTWTPFNKSTTLNPPFVLGARAAETSTRSAEPVQGLSAFVYASGYAPLVRLAATMRAGRSYGPEGKVAVDVALGPYAEVFDGGFLFMRFGVRGQLEGNDLFTVNELEPLQTQLGFEYIAGGKIPVLFEMAGRGAVASGAHVSVGDFSRTLKPVPAWGGHVALSVGPFRGEVVLTQILPSGASRAALDIAEVIACLRTGPLTLCGDHSEVFTGLFGPGAAYHRENIVMTGFTLGTSL
jgi:hypothetical protein